MPLLLYLGSGDPHWPPFDHEEADEELVRLKLLSGSYALADHEEPYARRGRARFQYRFSPDDLRRSA